MFITVEEKVGTSYLEFQFCKRKKPIIPIFTLFDSIEYWKKDSVLISYEDWEDFYKFYGNIFNCASFPNGEKGFNSYGINHYDKKTAEKILLELNKVIDKEKYINLIFWLEDAVNKYNGFYILGI